MQAKAEAEVHSESDHAQNDADGEYGTRGRADRRIEGKQAHATILVRLLV